MKIALVKSDSKSVLLSEFRKLSKSDKGQYVAEIYLKLGDNPKNISLKVDMDVNISNIKLVHYRAKHVNTMFVIDTVEERVRLTYVKCPPFFRMVVHGEEDNLTFNIERINRKITAGPNLHLIRMYVSVAPKWTVYDTSNFIKKEVLNSSHNFLNTGQTGQNAVENQKLAAFKYLYMVGPHILREADLQLAPTLVAAFCANQISEEELVRPLCCALNLI